MHKMTYWRWEQAVPDYICDNIINTTDWDNAKEGVIYGENNLGVNRKIRRTDVVWVDVYQPISCIMGMHTIAANNNANWNFNIQSGLENVQLGRYKSKNKGHYDWHKDVSSNPEIDCGRKLTTVVILNDPSEFEGGKL